MSTETIACANEPCQCMVVAEVSPLTSDEPAAAYCSGHCAGRETGEEEEACACGHPPCDQP
jgi:hypothetical protein